MKVLLEDAIQTSQDPAGSVKLPPGSQSSDTTLSASLELLISQLLGSHEPKKLSTLAR